MFFFLFFSFSFFCFSCFFLPLCAQAVSDEWDDCATLSASEQQTLDEWVSKFMFKYPKRGTLVREKGKAAPAPEAADKKAA